MVPSYQACFFQLCLQLVNICKYQLLLTKTSNVIYTGTVNFISVFCIYSAYCIWIWFCFVSLRFEFRFSDSAEFYKIQNFLINIIFITKLTGSPKQSSQPQTASPSPSPYSNIRSPEHWLPYPDGIEYYISLIFPDDNEKDLFIVIQGAITAVTAKMNNVELRGRVASCLSDVLTNQRSLLAAYQLHFEV